MECFNDLLLKLQEVHEQEVEGWQVKVQELSNKKGCDTKRMEELFTRNQQMKEQQRLLTENIKTLENRLRAGLCDRCTVTQEIAKKRQQDFEASQIQSLQHISVLAGEMNNLKKENKRLKDEIKNLRAALESHSALSSSSTAGTEVKPNSSPGLATSSVPVALIAMATTRPNSQPSDGNGVVKTETNQRSEDAEHRQVRGMNRSHMESYKPFSLSALTLPHRKIEHAVTHAGEKRLAGVEGVEQRSSIPPHALLLKNSSSSVGGETNPGRPVLHAPVPCRPQPIKSVPLPWPLPESCDWVNAAATGSSLVLQPSSKPNLPRFPNLVPTGQPASPRRQVFGSLWQKQSSSQPHTKEPTVVFRLKSLQEHVESQTVPQEKKEILPLKVEKAPTWHREACEGPLDLSDRGKPKSSQTPPDDSSLTLQGGEKKQKSPDKDVKTHSSPHVSISSTSPVMSPSLSSSSTPPVKQEDDASEQNLKVIKEQEQKEEVNGKTAQSNEKKVPVLTISLRPVVVLETLNSALQKQESLSANGKSTSPAAEPRSSSDEEQSGLGQESTQGCKRKRAAVGAEPGRDSDTDNTQQERKLKMTMRSDEKGSS